MAEEESSARQWVADLPPARLQARRIATIALTLSVLIFVALAIVVIILEHRAGGRFDAATNAQVALPMIGSILLMIVLLFVRFVMADRVDAQRRDAARDWMGARPRPPLALPDVFASAFLERRWVSGIAFVMLVIGGFIGLAGIVFFAIGDEEFPQPVWAWGLSGLTLGVIVIVLAMKLSGRAKPHPPPDRIGDGPAWVTRPLTAENL